MPGQRLTVHTSRESPRGRSIPLGAILGAILIVQAAVIWLFVALVPKILETVAG